MGIGVAPVDPKDLRKAQLRMIEILQEIDRICQKYDINWWINYGTLLGAVRHKGFIPWDDDCDICMTRDDYDKFVAVVSKELGEQFFFQTKDTDPQYTKNMTKVRLNNTTLVEVDEEIGEKYHQGIFVDIFVWDYYPSYATDLLKFFQIMPALRQKRKKYPRGTFMRSFVGVLTAIPYVFHSALEKIFKFIWSFNSRNPNMKYIGIEVRLNDGYLFNPKSIFPIKRELEFEGHIFPTPNDCDDVLKIKYGNYMELPPVEKRMFHAKKINADG